MDFNRQILLINYDVSKTLTENVQIVEQIPFINPTINLDPKIASDWFWGWIKTWDHHDWIDFASIASVFLLPPPANMIISLALDLTNVASFALEGKPWDAGLRAAFAVIPSGILLQKIPVVRKYGKKFVEQTYSKFIKLSSTEKFVKNGKIKMSSKEIEILDQLKKYSSWLKTTSQRRIFYYFMLWIIEKNTIWQTVRILQIFSIKFNFQIKVGTFLGMFFGIPWTYEKVLIYFGWSKESFSNNQAGFISYCKKLGYQFVKFDSAEKKWIAKDKDNQKYHFYYVNKSHTFQEDKITKKLTGESLTNEFTNQVQESTQNLPPEKIQKVMYDVIQSIIQDPIVADTVKNKEPFKISDYETNMEDVDIDKENYRLKDNLYLPQKKPPLIPKRK